MHPEKMPIQKPEAEQGQALAGALIALQDFGASGADLSEAHSMEIGTSISGISAKGSWSLSREGDNSYRVQTDGESEPAETNE